MSDGVLTRRPISERSTTTILRQRHTATAVTTATATSAPVGPPSGKEWVIHNALVTAMYVGDPGSDVGAGAYGQIVGIGPLVEFVAVQAHAIDEEAIQPGQAAPDITLVFGDTAQLFVDATNSIVSVNGILTFWGFEYDAL